MSTQSVSYRDFKGVSNSILSEFENNIKNFKSYWLYNSPFEIKKTESLLLGSLVDTLLTRPNDIDTIFYVFKEQVPKPQMLSFCEALYEEQLKLNASGLTITPAMVEESKLNSYKAVGFKADSFEKVKTRFATEGLPYFTFLIKSEGKTVVTQDMLNKARIIVEDLKNSPFPEVPTVAFLPDSDTSAFRVINQLEIYDIYTAEEGGCNIETKGALDEVVIRHLDKTAQPYDFKTSFTLNEFQDSYVKYKYFRQASYYTWLLQRWLVKHGLEGYTVLPFKFLVISTAGEGAYFYTVSKSDLEIAEHGGVIDGVYYKGWRTLLNDICWHVQNDKWLYPKEVYQSGGNILLEVFTKPKV